MFVWLKKGYGGGSTATLVGTLVKLVTSDLNAEPVQGATRMIKLASSIDVKIPNEVISALILSRLPPQFSGLRDAIVLANTMPDPNELVAKIDGCASLMPSAESPYVLTTQDEENSGANKPRDKARDDTAGGGPECLKPDEFYRFYSHALKFRSTTRRSLVATTSCGSASAAP